MIRPSTAMVKREVEKFNLPIKDTVNDENLERAFKFVCELEEDAMDFWEMPDEETAVERLQQLLTGEHTAGADDRNNNQASYIASLGDGDAEARLRVLARRSIKALEYFQNKETVMPDEETFNFLQACSKWVAFGKKEGVKYSKVFQGRSIQAASVSLKDIWAVALRPSAERWSGRDLFFREGTDQDRVVPPHLDSIYRNAHKAYAFDGKGWDRNMSKKYIDLFFRYIGNLKPGIPVSFLAWMSSLTACGVVIFSDGTSLLKERGNPSGHPATLWLNCFVNFLACTTCFYEAMGVEATEDAIRKRDIFPEFTGDDSRFWMTKNISLDHNLLLKAFEKTPWEFKVEGIWERN